MFFWIFTHEQTKKYLILSDNELGERDGRWKLAEEGWDLLWDSAFNRRQARTYIEEFYPEYTGFAFTVVPISYREACAYVDANHRHHRRPQGHKYSIGVSDGNKVVGVIMVGRPVSRHMDDGRTLEVTRCCVDETYKNTCSFLYARAAKVAKDLGYARIITYTLADEPGSSLRGAGFHCTGESNGGSWSSRNRKRIDRHPLGKKRVWGLCLQ